MAENPTPARETSGTDGDSERPIGMPARSRLAMHGHNVHLGRHQQKLSRGVSGRSSTHRRRPPAVQRSQEAHGRAVSRSVRHAGLAGEGGG